MLDEFNNTFIETIYLLRSSEELSLFEMISNVDKTENEVSDFLRNEYKKESLDYPHIVPQYDSNAALWGAKVVYFAGHLLINRSNKPEDLTSYFPAQTFEKSASAILSVDLCLRFLPDLIRQLELLQSDDPLVQLLNDILLKWHYSGISYNEGVDKLEFKSILADKCLLQLYIDRIIDKKVRNYLQTPLASYILGSLGEHKMTYWKEL